MKRTLPLLAAFSCLLCTAVRAETLHVIRGESPGWARQILVTRSPELPSAPASAAFRAGDPAQTARDQLERHAAQLFGPRAQERPELRVTRVRRSASGHQVFHRQFHRGVPVDETRVVVRLDRSGRLLSIYNDATPGISLEDVSPGVPARLAIDRLEQSLGQGSVARTPETAELVVLPDDGGRLAYRVEGTYFKPFVDMVAYVDAKNGEWIRGYDRMIHEKPVPAGYSVEVPVEQGPLPAATGKRAEGTGLVLPHNPLDGHPERYDLRDGDPVIDTFRESVTLSRLDGSGLLRGDYVDVENGDQARANEPTFTYNYSSLVEDGAFHEVNAYWHIDEFQHYIKSELQIDGANDEMQYVRVHGQEGDNSSYSSGSDSIDLGDGGVDDSEDGEVILHEYGHAVHDAIAGINVGVHENAALSEGFGDYIAASYCDNALVAEWDATSYNPGPPPNLRRTDTSKQYPQSMTNSSVHADGEIISAAWWDLRQDVGALVADRLIFEAMFHFPNDGNFRDFADATVMAEQSLYGGTHYESIIDAYSGRGIHSSLALLLAHTPLVDSQEKGPFNVTVDLTTTLQLDPDDPMTLYHRLRGESQFQQVAMAPVSGSEWTATIPDSGLDTNHTVEYYFVALAQNGVSVREPASGDYSFDVVLQDFPSAVVLDQNVPNPFNPTTSISFSVPRDGRATIRVYDSAGRFVTTLFDEVVSAGPITPPVEWDGTDDAGRPVSSGVYYYRLEHDAGDEARRMLLLR